MRDNGWEGEGEGGAAVVATEVFDTARRGMSECERRLSVSLGGEVYESPSPRSWRERVSPLPSGIRCTLTGGADAERKSAASTATVVIRLTPSRLGDPSVKSAVEEDMGVRWSCKAKETGKEDLTRGTCFKGIHFFPPPFPPSTCLES